MALIIKLSIETIESVEKLIQENNPSESVGKTFL